MIGYVLSGIYTNFDVIPFDSYKWWVPLTYTTNTERNFDKTMTDVQWFNTTTQGKASVRSGQASFGLTQQLEVRLWSDHDRCPLVQHNNWR